MNKKELLELRKKLFGCVDCKKDTMNLIDYYMVNDDLWLKYGVKEGCLCIKCFMKRLGRRLILEDFNDYKDSITNNSNIYFLALKKNMNLNKYIELLMNLSLMNLSQKEIQKELKILEYIEQQ